MGRRLSRDEAREEVIRELIRAGWTWDTRSGGDSRGVVSRAVYLSPDGQRRVLIRTGVRFEVGGRGKWRKDRAMHPVDFQTTGVVQFCVAMQRDGLARMLQATEVARG